ncbi:hypothetical protein D3C87_1521260 [compost metagenome]
MHNVVMLRERACQPRLGIGQCLPCPISKPHIRTEQHGDQAGRRVAPGTLSMHGAAVLRGGGQGDQVRHGDLMRNLRSVHIGKGIERARLLKRATVRGRVRRMGQAHAAFRRLTQVVEHNQGCCRDRHYHHAQHQCLAMLNAGRHAHLRHHFASEALPVKDLSDRALA